MRPVRQPRAERAAPTAASSSATTTSTTPLPACTAVGPTSPGATTPSPPASIIAGPPMPMLLPLVATTTSQTPTSAAFPAKQYPETTATVGPRPAGRAIVVKVGTSSRDPPAVSVSPG